jgi:NAD(P)-dependent dehydrogenase (short-subunit alcohol dehydrogenase family)
MAQHLNGKVAVITGAGSDLGIGKEVALAMAAEGAKVVVNDIGKNADGTRGADKVVEEIKNAGGIALANYESVSTMSGTAIIVKTAIDNFGRIDIVVNTAGIFQIKPTVDVTEAEWDNMLAIHLKGTFGCVQAAVKEMLKQKSGGRIINFTSHAGWATGLGPGPTVPYITAKAGILGFTKGLSLELEKEGITVNAVAPRAATRLFPIPGKIVNGVQIYGPEYVAPLVVYLATEEAKGVTGQFFHIGSGEIAVYATPLNFKAQHQHLFRDRKWTVDELIEVIPQYINKNIDASSSEAGIGY